MRGTVAFLAQEIKWRKYRKHYLHSLPSPLYRVAFYISTLTQKLHLLLVGGPSAAADFRRVQPLALGRSSLLGGTARTRAVVELGF